MARRKSDRIRWVAWTSTAVSGLLLLFAGFVYKPAPSVDTQLSSAGFYVKMGMLDEARSTLDEVLCSDPSNPRAHLLMACVIQVQGDAAAALPHYERGREAIVAAGDPGLLADFHVTTGLLRLVCGDFLGAERDANRILAENHRPAAGFVIWAFSRLGAGDDTDFRQGLARAYSLDPLDPIFRTPGESISEAIPWAPAYCIGL